ncbi:hypothetical protein RB595_004141 [Gaeumannomyces hyphopodioides]
MVVVPIYFPLDSRRREIRVLELLAPDAYQDDVYASVRLGTLSLADESPPFFAALSYVWGDASDTRPILLNGTRWHVTRNLAEALKRLTRIAHESGNPKPAAFRVWADAICINQVDVDERARQVSMMGDIFASSSLVYSFLGIDDFIPVAIRGMEILAKGLKTLPWSRESGEIDEAMVGWLQRQPELYSVDANPRNSSVPDTYWEALDEFTGLAYWRRMWIFQEVVLPRLGSIIFIGREGPTINDTQLYDGLKHLERLVSFVRAAERPAFCPEGVWRRLRSARPSAERVSQQILPPINFRAVDERSHAALRVVDCINAAFYRTVDATDPRDYYYSIIGAARIPLRPSYEDAKRIEHVCVDFVGAYLETARGSPWALAFLDGAAGSALKSHGIPSWALPLHLPSRRSLASTYEPDASPLRVVLRDASRADEGVFGTVARSPDMALLPQMCGAILCVLGVRVDAVTFTSAWPGFNFLRGMSSFLVGYVRRHGGVYSKTSPPMPAAKALLATLMQDVQGHSWDFAKGLEILKAVPTDKPQAWEDIMEAYVAEQPSGAAPAGAGGAPRDLAEAAEFEEFRSKHTRNVQGHVFETAQGYLGIAPPDARLGDEVCFIDGYDYPALLRPVGNSQYVFVGACWVTGLASEEAKKLVGSGQVTPEVMEMV